MKNFLFSRLLQAPSRSFFLFGPRSVGKSHWLKAHFPHAIFFDLLDHRLFLEFSKNPENLEARIEAQVRQDWICLDEIQKIPTLLDEVHRLIEKKNYRFVLSGSSARKLKRGGADLLAGRAVTRHMESLSFPEMGEEFHLKKILEWGSLPLVVLNSQDAADILSAYVHTYLKEEIKEEGLVRKTEPFIRFLEIAGLMNGKQLNRENIARDAKIPRSTVDTYFSILEDTLVGHFLPAFRPEIKVREQVHPKFFWFDAGVARGAAGLLHDPADSTWLGHALETFIFHELRIYNQTSQKHRKIFFYRTGSGSEIDFVIETQKRTTQNKTKVICIEVKNSSKWQHHWEKPMRSLAESSSLKVEKMLGIYRGTESYHFEGLDVLPVEIFLKKLFAGEVF